MSTAALALARATTIVPSKSRSRRSGGRSRTVPAQRPSPEYDAPVQADPEALAYTVAPHDDPVAESPQTPPTWPAAHETYAEPDDYAEASDELLGQPNSLPVLPEARPGSAAWRMLRSLRPRRRGRADADDEPWTPETGIDDPDETLDGEQWTYPSTAAAEPPPSTPASGLRAAPAGLHPSGADDQLAQDRAALRTLGVPAAWTRHLQAGDRFTSIVSLLSRLPELQIPDDVSVIAVVGPSDVVELEAHRTALDLPAGGRPRAVAAVPGAGAGAERRTAIAASKRTRPVVVAIAVDGYDDPADVRATLAQVKAESVIAVIDASRPLDETARWIEALENVDAIALDGALDNARPAEVLNLDVPVIRVDGIAVDRIGWAALLCAQLTVMDLQGAPQDSISQR